MASKAAPQDRRPKARVKVDDRTVTIGGHEYVIVGDALDDFEILDDLQQVQNGEIARLPILLRRILGTDAYLVAMNRLRSPETGRVTIEAGTDFVSAILDGLAPNS